MNIEGQASGAIGGFVETVRGAAEDLVDAEKARLADLIHGVATALRQGGDELGAVVAGHAETSPTASIISPTDCASGRGGRLSPISRTAHGAGPNCSSPAPSPSASCWAG